MVRCIDREVPTHVVFWVGIDRFLPLVWLGVGERSLRDTVCTVSCTVRTCAKIYKGLLIKMCVTQATYTVGDDLCLLVGKKKSSEMTHSKEKIFHMSRRATLL